MTPRQDDLESLARAIDRVVFHDGAQAGDHNASAASLALISYLNDSFPRMAVAGGRRDRLQRRLMHALRIPRAEAATGWGRLEAELNHRLSQVDPRWTPLVGGAALVLLGVLGVAVWRQRGAIKPAVVSLR
ncbi:MAG: hypothetical protein E6I88_06420 [Chloroflexi bacterium]|nr:MAG: hypothetical protein E6I88_06420 [Chloroflexota bacterium]TME48790.1 MAG: hypothetical protein E6I56_00130 [Chloroflexota bacterium]